MRNPLMPLRALLPVIAAALCVSTAFATGKETVGLVLSGGGAKGIAHVGVIKALEENDIPIDYVTGTSMGAIVGSLYSCGWSPEKMLAFFTAPDFNYWATGQLNPDYIYYFSEADPTPQWVDFNISLTKKNNIADQIIPGSLVSPLPMNIEFLRIFSKYTVQCHEDFNFLFVPFRCVTSDIYHKHKVVLSRGSLGDAVRASMSFPLVYRPIEINGLLMFDGGIYDNFPVDVMQQDFHPDFIIGVSVSAPDKKPQPGNPYSQLEDMIIQNNDYSVPEKEGVKIQVPVLDFGVLDFEDATTIYEIGYKTGLEMVDSIKRRVSSRRPLSDVTHHRERFAKATPVMEFDSVEVTGATKRQAKYLKFLFDEGLDRPFGMQQAYDAYYRAVAGGKLSDLLPQSHPSLRADSLQEEADRAVNPDRRPVVSANTLSLQADVKNPWNVGIGGWVTSSTQSMLYLTLGYHTLDYRSLDIDASFWIGQSYSAAMLSGKFTLPSRIPSFLQVQGVISRQKYYDSDLLFYQNTSPSFITDIENMVRLNYCMAVGRQAKAWASVGYGYQYDKYYPLKDGGFTDIHKEKSAYRTLAARLEYERNTLDFPLYPSSGMRFEVGAVAAREETRTMAEKTPSDLRPPYRAYWRGHLKADWEQYFKLNRHIALGASASAVGTLSRLFENYTATLIHSQAFEPTPSTCNYFNPAFRADNYAAAGLLPIWMPVSNFQLRGSFNLFLPIRNVTELPDGSCAWDGWFRNPQFIGEVAAVYNFKFASLSLYGNYLSAPARNWNFGVNFGLYFQAPKLVR